MLTSKVMFELGLRRAQRFDLLMGGKEEEKKISNLRETFFFPERKLNYFD